MLRKLLESRRKESQGQAAMKTTHSALGEVNPNAVSPAHNWQGGSPLGSRADAENARAA